MQIVIDIPDDEYNAICSGTFDTDGYFKMNLSDAFTNGTPLPKGHGDLVDYRELKNNAKEYGAYAEAILSHIKPKTIIEADKERSK